MIVAESRREHRQNLGQPLTVPDWASPVHRRGNHVVPVGVVEADLKKHSPDLLKNWLNTMRHGDGAIGRGQEVGETRNDAHVRHGLDLAQGLDENLKRGTNQHLGRFHGRMGSTISLVHVVPDVGISNQAKSLDLDGEVGLRHDVVRRRPEQE